MLSGARGGAGLGAIVGPRDVGAGAGDDAAGLRPGAAGRVRIVDAIGAVGHRGEGQHRLRLCVVADAEQRQHGIFHGRIGAEDVFLQEYILGTNPTVKDAVLPLLRISNNAQAQSVLTFSTMPDRTYRIYYSDAPG